MIVVHVTLSGYGRRGQKFNAMVDNEILVENSPMPFLDASRVLIDRGIAPSTRIVMRHVGKDYDAVRSTVGAAAKLMVSDTKNGKAHFIPWRPFVKGVTIGIAD